tara:strand:- start:2864 stop:3106 length:243 start_codon:yes stop_codon:yes gene_type:complete
MKDYITKPSISRLGKKAGVKSIADDTFKIIQEYLNDELESIIKKIIIMNNEQNTKTIMIDDVYKAFNLSGIYLAQSNELI